MTSAGAQALSLGLGDRWEKVKDSYAHANRALGDIVKVTPSSKVRAPCCAAVSCMRRPCVRQQRSCPPRCGVRRVADPTRTVKQCGPRGCLRSDRPPAILV